MKTPKCAYCGKKLSGAGAPKGCASVELHYRGIPGCPRVGWHAPDCLKADMETYLGVRGDLGGNEAQYIREIELRGADRISVSKNWNAKRPWEAAQPQKAE